jgi:hypothetical protein
MLALLNKLWLPELSFRLLEGVFIVNWNSRKGKHLHANQTAPEGI